MNNEKMKNHLKNADMDKLAAVIEIKKAYNDGKYNLEEARKLLKEKVTTLTPEEIALAEQELTVEEDDECRKEDIQKMMELFDGILVTGGPRARFLCGFCYRTFRKNPLSAPKWVDKGFSFKV